MNYSEIVDSVICLVNGYETEDVCLNYVHPAEIISAFKELDYTVSTCSSDPDDMVINRYFIDHNIRFYIFKNGKYENLFIETNLLNGTTYIRTDKDDN